MADDVSTRLTLKNELQEVTAADWFPLGVQLGIKPAKLKEIEKDHPGDVRRCKIEVLDWWHRNALEVSWKKLAHALEKTGDYDALAQRLRRKTPTKAPTSRITGHPTAPHVMSPTLQAGSQNPVVPAVHQILQTHSDAAFPLTAEQEAAVVDIGVTDLQCGSYHFSQQEDAPSRFLPRAFSGLQESVQERTQDLSREHQPPPQLFQCKGFHHITYNILSYVDDARSLCRAEQVCSEWYRVIAVELLWKKLIERKVKTDPVWRGLSQRRGWDKYLSRRVPPSEGITDEFYRQLYPNIVRDINNLQINWKNGHHTLTRIECGEIAKGGGVNCLQYDDAKIVSGHVDNTIKIWNRKSLKCSTVLQGHTDMVRCLQYDDRVIITGSDDSTIRVWDMNDGSMLNKLDHHRDPVWDLKFNSDTMVTGSEGGTVAVWDMMSPMDIFLRKELKGHSYAVYGLDFDEQYIVSGSEDQTIKVWRTSNGECVRTLHGHRGSVYCLQYRGNHIISGSLDHTIRIWDIESGACLKILEGHNDIWCIRFDDKRIVSGSYDGEVKVWDFQAALDPRSQPDTLCLQTLREHSDWVNSLQFDDFQIVSGSDDATILIWDFLDPVPPGPIDTDQSDNKKALT